MKKWQHGIELDILKGISDFFNKSDGDYLKSPFTEVNKRTAAVYLSRYEMIMNPDYMVVVTQAKTKTAVKDFSGNVIAHRQKGDKFIPRFAYTDDKVFKTIDKIKGNLWIHVWQEKKDEVEAIKSLGFKHVCTKITSHAEIFGIYYRGSELKTTIPQSQLISLEKRCDADVEEVIKELNSLDLEFTNHFSNYNPTDSWGALALRGYSPDYKFISKPGVMGKKWKDDGTDYKLQYTELWDRMPSVKRLLERHFPKGIEYDRIRFMRLGKEVGVLERHSDKTEKDAGVDDGKIARFHFPLQTNEDVWFEMWDCNGELIKKNLPVGEMWYLDMRKPHRASNCGKTDRIHLVVDVFATPEIRELLGDNKVTDVEDLFE